MPISYVGRFAPTPSGPLHFGSLVAALASYLDAKHNHGAWLLRIDNIDPPREDPNAIPLILNTLERYGLHWDGEVLYQGDRLDAYADAFAHLQSLDHVYPCECTRKAMAGRVHSERCTPTQTDDVAWRLICPRGDGAIHDVLQGRYAFHWQSDIGDFIVKRRDRLWTYQLANVVDDAHQGITHVVRGIDLIDSSARQQALIQTLNHTPPQYAHLPVANGTDGKKLSKQAHAKAIPNDHPEHMLWSALHWLRQQPPMALQHAHCDDILNWGIEHWRLEALIGLRAQPAVSF